MKILDKVVVYSLSSLALAGVIIAALDDYTRLFKDLF